MEEYFLDDKVYENIDTYSLSNLYNILKVHEQEFKEIIDEKEKNDFGGPLALISKTCVKEVCSDGEQGDTKEGLLINSDHEAVAYYSNNRVKKFYGQEAYAW